MKSKIIQISSCLTKEVLCITALCDDGSVWVSMDWKSWEVLEEPFESAQQKNIVAEKSTDNTANGAEAEEICPHFRGTGKKCVWNYVSMCSCAVEPCKLRHL